ncbi:hypothetical protein OAC01_01110 [bacterium]|nr:hypothetical protein [bacterium]
MILLATLKRQIGKFRKEEEGASQSVEFLLSFPLLVWALLATLQYFDAYRTQLISTKATITIGDMISREKGTIDSVYIKGTSDLLNFLTIADDSPDLRISVVSWNASESKHKVVWSEFSGALGRLNDANINAYFDVIPIMGDGERTIIVETVTRYTPKFGTSIGQIFRVRGLEPMDMNSIQVIRPRFTTSVCWDQSPSDSNPPKC